MVAHPGVVVDNASLPVNDPPCFAGRFVLQQAFGIDIIGAPDYNSGS